MVYWYSEFYVCGSQVFKKEIQNQKQLETKPHTQKPQTNQKKQTKKHQHKGVFLPTVFTYRVYFR